MKARTENLIIGLCILAILAIAFAVDKTFKDIDDHTQWITTSSPSQLRKAIRSCRIAHVEDIGHEVRVRCIEEQNDE